MSAISWTLPSFTCDTLSALRQHLRAGWRSGRIVVWAHNSHPGDARATQMGERGEWNVGHRAELYRRMVFNIMVTNDDDHLRNHAFLYDATSGGWRLSPLYDVVPRPMLATERYLAIGIGEQGRVATSTSSDILLFT